MQRFAILTLEEILHIPIVSLKEKNLVEENWRGSFWHDSIPYTNIENNQIHSYEGTYRNVLIGNVLLVFVICNACPVHLFGNAYATEIA